MTDTPYHRFQSLKILTHADRLRSIAEGGEPYPIEWVVYPSNRCNHRCVFCLYRHAAPDGSIEQFDYAVILPRATLLRFVEDAARLGGTVIQFEGGGEPLINKATPEALRLANELGIKTAMSTNGRLLTPAIAATVDYLRISLNAGTAEQHWKTNHGADVTDTGDWDIIIDNIRHSLPHKRKDVGLAFVIDAENYRDIPAFCRLAADLGVDFVHLRPAFYYGATEDAAVRAVMSEALALCDQMRAELAGDPLQIFAITEKFAGYWSPRTYSRCRAIWTGVVLRATGDFAVCKDRTDLVWGGAYRGGATFEEVWHSEGRRALVSQIHDGEGGILPSCPRCVWTTRNALIESAFVNDDMRIALV
jgi:MoaA/NifB/PqqE/SkfB family radical SAM enzyme